MSIRIVKYELEAKLTGKPYGFFSKPSGKVERKSYGDGGERLKISIRNIKAPDLTIALAKADGKQIAEMSLNKGAAKVDIESKDGASIPALEVGQTIEIEINGESLLSGQLYID